MHELQCELANQGICSKRWTTSKGRAVGGVAFNRGALFHLLRNPIYLGRIRHKGVVHEGRHEAIVEEKQFDRAQALLDCHAPRRRERADRPVRSTLTGKLFDANSEVMSPVFARGSSGKLYRYYVSASLQQGSKPPKDDVLRRISAPDLEKVLTELIVRWLPPSRSPLDLISAINLRNDGLLIDLPRKFTKALASSLMAEETIIYSNDQSARIWVPLQLPLRGGKRLVLAGSSQLARPDPALIAALRKAHGMVANKRGMPIIEAAPASQHDRKILRLAFLAPDMQRDILAGLQPASLNLEALKTIKIPIDWTKQRKVLGWPVRA